MKYKLIKLLQLLKLFKKHQFKNLGIGCNITKPFIVKNPKYISIGNNFNALNNFRIEAWDEYDNQKFTPKIKIGNNVCFNTDIHIGCIDSIEIGDNCLFASRIFITDHSHGNTDIEHLKIPPINRPLISKGPVIIKNNVWVGEGVTILSGVTIGENSVIGANSVVTKNIPSFSIACGMPAKVIKSF